MDPIEKRKQPQPGLGKQGPNKNQVEDLAIPQQPQSTLWSRMLDNVYSLFGSNTNGSSKETEKTEESVMTKGVTDRKDLVAQAPAQQVMPTFSKTPEEITARLDPMIAFAKAGKIDRAFEVYKDYLDSLGIDPLRSQHSGEDNPVRDAAMKRLQELSGGFKSEGIWDYLIHLRDEVTRERLKNTKTIEARINSGLTESKYVLVFYGDKAYLIATGFSYHTMEVNCFKHTFDSAEEAEKMHVAWGGKITIGPDKVTLYSDSTAYGGPSEYLLAAMAPLIKSAFKVPVVGKAFHDALNKS